MNRVKIAAFISIALVCIIMGGRAFFGGDVAARRSAIIVPTQATPHESDFIYLGAIPAAAKANDGKPVVIAVDQFGSINPETRHYFGYYKPEQVFAVDTFLHPLAYWPTAGRGAQVSAKGVAGQAERSVMCWVKMEKDTKGGELLSWGSGRGGEWRLLVTENGNLAVNIGGAQKAGKTDIRDGQWHYVMATLERVPDGSAAYIKDVNLFVDSKKEPICDSFDKASSPLCEKLAGYWKFEEGVGGSSADATEFNTRADLQWEAYPMLWNDEGKTGKCVQLNGRGNRIQLDIARQPVGLDGTVKGAAASLWVKIESSGHIFGNQSWTGGGWGVQCDNNGRLVAHFNGPDPDKLKDVRPLTILRNLLVPADDKKYNVFDSQWHHIVLTFDANAKRMALYLDGRLLADESDNVTKRFLFNKITKPDMETVSTGKFTLPGLSSGAPMRVGMQEWRGKYCKPMRGAVDELAIWNRALTEEEIATLYGGGKGHELEVIRTPLRTVEGNISVAGATFYGEIKEVRLYDRAATIEDSLSLSGAPYDVTKTFPYTNAETMACTFAEEFWSESEKAVVCDGEDYQSALVASVVAARFRIPLLYSDKSGGLSVGARDVIASLGVKELLFVGSGKCPTVSGIKATTIADAEEAMVYLNSNGKKVDYFSVCNPLDRDTGEVTKNSLSAALLASGREGALIPLSYKTEFKIETKPEEQVTTPPEGLTRDGMKTSTQSFLLTDDRPAMLVQESGKAANIYPVHGKFAAPGKSAGQMMALAASKPNTVTFDVLLYDSSRNNKFDPDEVFKVGDAVRRLGPRGSYFDRVKSIRKQGNGYGVVFEHSSWWVGAADFNTGTTYKFAIAAKDLYLDFNKNGRFEEPKEGPFFSSQILKIDGKRISINFKDVICHTYPSYHEINEVLRGYYKALGRHPEYMCIVGMPDAVPMAMLSVSNAWDLPNDFPYGVVDDDQFVDICVGRFVNISRTYMTVAAARSLTHDDLIGDPKEWASRQLWTGIFGWNQVTVGYKLMNAGYQKHVVAEATDNLDFTRFGAVVQDDHGGPGGVKHFHCNMKEHMAPCVIELGGCLTGGIDLDVVEGLASPTYLRMGAVAHIGTMRGTGGPKDNFRQAFWNSIAAGKTTGQAVRTGRNVLITLMCNGAGRLMTGTDKFYTPNETYYWYCLANENLYGDPAVKPYSRELKDKQIWIEDLGETLRLHNQEAYYTDWEHRFMCSEGKYKGKYRTTYKQEEADRLMEQGAPFKQGWMYTGPSTLAAYLSRRPSWCEWHTTRNDVVGVEQITRLEKPVSGMIGQSYVDKHQDGTRSIYWIAHLEDWDQENGEVKGIVKTIDLKPIIKK